MQIGADGPLADAGHEALDHGEVDVGLEERETDLAQDLVDIGLAQAALAAELLEDSVETI